MSNFLAIMGETRKALSRVMNWTQYHNLDRTTIENVEATVLTLSVIKGRAATEAEVDMYVDLLVYHEVEQFQARTLAEATSFKAAHLALDYIRESGVNLDQDSQEAEEAEVLAIAKIAEVFNPPSAAALDTLVTELWANSKSAETFEDLLLEITQYPEKYLGELKDGLRRV